MPYMSLTTPSASSFGQDSAPVCSYFHALRAIQSCHSRIGQWSIARSPGVSGAERLSTFRSSEAGRLKHAVDL